MGVVLIPVSPCFLATEGWGGSEIALSREKEREREVFIRRESGTVEPLSLYMRILLN